MSAGSPPFTPDLQRLRRSFDRAGPGYDTAAVLHAEVRGILLQRLDLTALEPRVVLDAGAGTAQASRALKRRYPRARVLALDCSLGMLRAARQPRFWGRRFDRVCADAHRLPFADAGVDLILSNLMMPWCDPDVVFAEFRRVLAPRGFLSFSSLGPDTLRELRAAWARVDTCSRVVQLLDMHDLGDALVRAGFAAPVLDVERYTLTYAELRGLMADLKAVGARHGVVGGVGDVGGAGRPRGSSRGRWAALRAAYEAYRTDGRLPATCEVVFGQAWAPASAAPAAVRAEQPGVTLEQLTRTLPSRRGA